MVHRVVDWAAIKSDRIKRRWSPQLGYAVALSGSAVIWSLAAFVLARLA